VENDLLVIIDKMLIFIEMKRTKGGVVSKEQKEWIERLDRADQCVILEKGCEDTMRGVELILSNKVLSDKKLLPPK
jgi:hypothetical protein